MTYDLKKDIEEWEKKHGKVIYINNMKLMPQMPKWLQGDEVKNARKNN